MPKKYIKRDIESKLLALSKTFSAVSLTGPRQTGKSTLLKHLFGKTHKYVSFDDPIIREKAISDPKNFIYDLGEKAIIDEVQYVPEILSYLKIEIDKKRNVKGKYLLTGSQQFSMIKNISETLAGRIALLELLPFSSEELKKSKSTITNFTYNCLHGFYPEIALRKNIDVDIWYSSYINTYIERDIKSIYNIGSLRDFQRFIQLLAARTGQILNLSTFSSEIGVSINTIKEWISILEASRIIYILSPYYESVGKRIVKSPKVYFLDCGIVCYLSGIKNKEHLINGPMNGALFETFCIQETIKTYFNAGKVPQAYFIRTNNNLEIDLLIKGKNSNFFPFEIKFSRTPKLSMTSNINRFKNLFSALNIKEGSIVSLSEEEFSLTKDISAISFESYIKKLQKII